MLTLEEILSDAAALSEFQHLDNMSVNSRGEGGETPLHWMAILGDSKAIEILMKNGAMVNVADHDGNTPLHEAVSSHHENAVDTLLKFGADAFQKNANGVTPCDIAEEDNALNLLSRLQNSVTINRITVGPTPYKLDVPKNYPFIIPFTVRTGIGTATNDLRLVLEAPSQPTGQIPEGIHIQLPAPVSLTERQTVSLPVQFIADSDAQPSGALIFDIVSSEQGNKPIGKVRLDYTLSEASPYLVGAPSFVETWLAQGESQIESITIKNSGIQDAENLRFDLTRANGAPAPAWARLGSVVDGTLAVGESH
jgi:hypothetical protein